DDEAGAAPRRDARVPDGRQAAVARARCAAAARHPRDVRLQGREVAAAHRPRREDGRRVLGAARGRPRRVDLVTWVRRFSRTERTLHWVNAAGFLTLAATGLILWLPALSVAVGRRPLIKDIHFWTGIAWISALVLVALLGDRRGLLRTARELERLDDGRFNPGQKVNAILNAAFAVLFLVSGLLLWFGERDTR